MISRGAEYVNVHYASGRYKGYVDVHMESMYDLTDGQRQAIEVGILALIDTITKIDADKQAISPLDGDA